MSWKFAIIIFAALSLAGCGNDNVIEVPNVDHIDVSVDIRRFEQDLFAIDTSQIEEGLAALEAKYPEFSEVYFTYVLGSKNPQMAPEGHEAYVKGFLQHPAIQFLYDTTQVVYPRLDDIQSEFAQAFKYLKYHFPDYPTPKVTTFISEYSIAAFIYGEGDLGVGLDFFLGSDYPYGRYVPNNPNFSAYLTRSFDRKHLVSKSLQPLVKDLVGEPRGNRLLDVMVNNGKQMYIQRALLPYTPDSILLELPETQVAWLKNNELEMWAHFLKEQLLYSTDFQKFRKLVDYSPSSPGMPPEAPGRTANYMGLKIVEAFMRRYPELSLQDLLGLEDAQYILEQSKYKPRG
ncbi:gliding motility lipoprotein GldB [Flavilitoribacter nigricans]|uniref:Gliding motility lipoprotein GldB n=1 Tax=Flavilitoribacter nigricans (strain ATCC 23147 / DSM 23189 / NBRC 102662 / NCIMB 1420 / SS-2) TaxID=1122177 RepID=A0A2D0N8G4_FLAN2|nr:hypothetical protein [Flavilitoribacter nigricans]PHN04801.1 hypothetical protein CRP01_20025 [Flavilitoribacter nigricans DSM 23189 = NBRC 102662]